MALDSAPKPSGGRGADVSFAAGVGNGLLQQICPAARLKQILYSPADCGERKALLKRDVVCGEIAVMNYDAPRCLPTQPSGAGDGEVNGRGIGIRNPINRKRRGVRDGDGLGAAIGFRPKYCLAVLREAPRREVGNPVYAPRDSFDSLAVGETGEHRIGEALRARLLGRDQSVIVLGQSDEFIETRAWHDASSETLKILSISFHIGTILTSVTRLESCRGKNPITCSAATERALLPGDEVRGVPKLCPNFIYSKC